MTASQAIFSAILVLVVLAVVLWRLFGNRPPKEMSYEDASRFAKLLITEIKLYEGYKVERGLRNNDLVGSLEIEIQKARKMFQAQIPDPEYAGVFDEALVAILADGDRSKLGPTVTP